MRRLASLSALIGAALALGGCDVFQRLQNDRVLAGVLLETPAIEAPAAPGAVVPGAVAATVFFGEIDKGANPADAGSWRTTGLDGATVTIAWSGGSAALTPAGAPGQYALAGGLSYQPGTAYTFRVEYQGDTYSGTVTAPARPTLQHDGAPLGTFDGPHAYAALPDPYVLGRSGTDVAFYAVSEVQAGASGLDVSAPTCTNAPDVKDPLAVLKLFVNDDAWRAPTFSLAKAQCFPDPGAMPGYAIALTTVNKVGGTGMSSNLFIGSGVMAGSSAASLLLLQ